MKKIAKIAAVLLALTFILAGADVFAQAKAKFHIGVVTGTVSQSEDDLRGAEALIKEFGAVKAGGRTVARTLSTTAPPAGAGLGAWAWNYPAGKGDYFALYPTLHLDLSSGKNEWQLNYSRRVNRPDGEDMNPVPEYRDPRNVFVGNPDLKPEDIHSIELGYSLRLKQLTLVPTLFYRYKIHGFAWVTSSLNDSVLITTIDNLATDQSAGLDLSGTWQIGKIANLNFSASGFYSQLDASNIGYEAGKSVFSWNGRINASISITKTTLFQINGQYRSQALTAQGMREPSWVVNLGFRQDLWKKKLSLIATISDLFDSQTMRSTVNTPILVQESVRRRDGRVFYAGFLFNIGTNGKKTKDTKFEFDNGL